VLRVVDPDGRPIADARVDIRDFNRWPNSPTGRTDAQGRYEVAGLTPGQSTVVDIVADKRSLGATLETPEFEPDRESPKTLQVRLQPLVTLSGRVLDDDGNPLSGGAVTLYRNVQYPGQSGRSFGLPVETGKAVNADGSYSFDRLIPGATYNSQVESSGHATASSNHVKIKPGHHVTLDAFRLPITDQDLSGIVVDAQGKPLGGVTVSYERTDRPRSLYAAHASVWFHDTDASGRFHLSGLPRGPVKLMAYRRSGRGGDLIRDIKHIDVRPGQTDVRIELPDPNDRLRGID
jgi:hypothetical protein